MHMEFFVFLAKPIENIAQFKTMIDLGKSLMFYRRIGFVLFCAFICKIRVLFVAIQFKAYFKSKTQWNKSIVNLKLARTTNVPYKPNVVETQTSVQQQQQQPNHKTTSELYFVCYLQLI